MRVKKGTAIFVEGQIADSAYFILDGRVLIGRHESWKPEQDMLNGDRLDEVPKPNIVLAKVGPGQLFGEYTLILGENEKRTATAYTLEDVELERVTRGEFERRVNALDPFMRQYLRTLIDQVVQTSKKVSSPSTDT